MRSWDQYWDEYQMIVQLDRDGGDSCQRMGMYYVGLKLLGIEKDFLGRKPSLGLIHAISTLRCGLGNFKRHPDKNKWYSDPDRMSRDQVTPIICALGLYGFKWILWDFLIAHILRLGFTTNTRRNHTYKPSDPRYTGPHHKYSHKWKLPDFTGPEFWSSIFRGLDWWFMYPLFFLGDLENLVNTLIIVFHRAKDRTEADDLNHIISTKFSLEKYPTPIIKWSWKIYNKYRPLAKRPPQSYSTKSGPQSALRYYFQIPRGGGPMDELWRPLVEGQ